MANNPDELSLASLKTIDWILIATVIVVLATAGWILNSNLRSQDQNYDHVIQQVLQTNDTRARLETHMSLLAFFRARDFANMKAASMLVGFLLIFTGALFLLKVFSLVYKLNADKTPVGNFGLESTSPGLVMITLGVAIMAVVLLSKTDVNLEGSQQQNLKPIVAELDSLEVLLSQIQKSIPQLPTRKVKVESLAAADSLFLPDGHFTPQQINYIVNRLKADASLKIYLVPMVTGSRAAEAQAKTSKIIAKIRIMLANAAIDQNRIKFTSHGESQTMADAPAGKSGVYIKISH